MRPIQSELNFGDPDLEKQVEARIRAQLAANEHPSAWDLLAGLEERFGWAARWVVQAVLNRLAADLSLSRAARQYLSSLLLSEDLADALRGAKAPRREVESSIDSLLRQSRAYRGLPQFERIPG